MGIMVLIIALDAKNWRSALKWNIKKFTQYKSMLLMEHKNMHWCSQCSVVENAIRRFGRPKSAGQACRRVGNRYLYKNFILNLYFKREYTKFTWENRFCPSTPGMLFFETGYTYCSFRMTISKLRTRQKSHIIIVYVHLTIWHFGCIPNIML